MPCTISSMSSINCHLLASSKPICAQCSKNQPGDQEDLGRI